MGTGTELGRVRGLGSAKAGAHHWLVQRVTAFGNLALVSWLLISLLRLPVYDYKALVAWPGSPLVAVPMMLMIVSIFWHMRLGLQVLIEDYFHGEASKIFMLMLLNFYCVAGAVFGLFSVAKLAFTTIAPAVGVAG